MTDTTMTDSSPVTPTQLKEILTKTYPIKRALCIEGPPGVGKTSICRQMAEEQEGMGYIEVHMPTALVEDFGIPDLMKSGSTFGYRLPKWFPAEDDSDFPDNGVLCFDDRNQASTDLQKVLANIIQARTLHGIPLKPGWQVISTGNRIQDRAGANRVLSHLRNRETKLELEVNLGDWTDWALKNGCAPEVVAFIRFRPDLLNGFDPNVDVSPTPRAWMEGVSPLLSVLPVELQLPAFTGSVGMPAAVEFCGFLRTMNSLPNVEDILNDPMTARLPEDNITRYAAVGMITKHISPDNLGKFVTYVTRFVDSHGVELKEFQVMLLLAGKHDYNIMETQAYTDLCVKLQDHLI